MTALMFQRNCRCVWVYHKGVFYWSNPDPDWLTGSFRFTKNQMNMPARQFALSCSQKENGDRKSAGCRGTHACDVFSYSCKRIIFGEKRIRWIQSTLLPEVVTWIRICLIRIHPIEHVQILWIQLIWIQVCPIERSPSLWLSTGSLVWDTVEREFFFTTPWS